jgi:hypothetical protein
VRSLQRRQQGRQFVPQGRRHVAGVVDDDALQALGGRLAVDQRQGSGGDGRRPAHPTPAAHQGRHLRQHQRRHRAHGQPEHLRVVARAVHEREAAGDQLARRLRRRVLHGQFHQGLDAGGEQGAEVPLLPAVADPQAVRHDLVHDSSPARALDGAPLILPNSAPRVPHAAAALALTAPAVPV